ncbi:MAG: alpha/beta hydrolase [Pseudomonadota bacterium]
MRTFFLLSFLLIAVVLIGLAIWTRFQVSAIKAQHPPTGLLSGMADGNLHYRYHIAPDGQADADQPVVLFIHGATGNLLDPYNAFAPVLKDKRSILFVDRPGHGYSPRNGSETPAAHARRYAQLLDSLKIDKAVLVGHSLGSASVAAFGVLFPERVQGLVFLAPATHPWPTGVDWYYDLASTPGLGWLFTETLTLPVGLGRVDSGVVSVFDPNPVAPGYAEKAAIELVFRPASFRANSRDVAGLNEFVLEFSKRYSEIKAPTVVITGDKDDVVAPSIHSVGLEQDIEGAELIVLPGVGHKPDYVATETVLKAIERVSK